MTGFLDQSNPFLLAPENQSIPLHPEKQYNESVVAKTKTPEN